MNVVDHAFIDYDTSGFFDKVKQAGQKLKKGAARLAGQGVEKLAKTQSITLPKVVIKKADETAVARWKRVAYGIEKAQNLAVHETSKLDKFENRRDAIKKAFQSYLVDGEDGADSPAKYYKDSKKVLSTTDKATLKELEDLRKDTEAASKKFRELFDDDRYDVLKRAFLKAHPEVEASISAAAP